MDTIADDGFCRNAGRGMRATFTMRASACPRYAPCGLKYPLFFGLAPKRTDAAARPAPCVILTAFDFAEPIRSVGYWCRGRDVKLKRLKEAVEFFVTDDRCLS
jgi:hypothetical protein